MPKRIHELLAAPAFTTGSDDDAPPAQRARTAAPDAWWQTQERVLGSLMRELEYPPRATRREQADVHRLSLTAADRDVLRMVLESPQACALDACHGGTRQRLIQALQGLQARSAPLVVDGEGRRFLADLHRHSGVSGVDGQRSPLSECEQRLAAAIYRWWRAERQAGERHRAPVAMALLRQVHDRRPQRIALSLDDLPVPRRIPASCPPALMPPQGAARPTARGVAPPSSSGASRPAPVSSAVAASASASAPLSSAGGASAPVLHAPVRSPTLTALLSDARRNTASALPLHTLRPLTTLRIRIGFRSAEELLSQGLQPHQLRELVVPDASALSAVPARAQPWVERIVIESRPLTRDELAHVAAQALRRFPNLLACESRLVGDARVPGQAPPPSPTIVFRHRPAALQAFDALQSALGTALTPRLWPDPCEAVTHAATLAWFDRPKLLEWAVATLQRSGGRAREVSAMDVFNILQPALTDANAAAACSLVLAGSAPGRPPRADTLEQLQRVCRAISTAPLLPIVGTCPLQIDAPADSWEQQLYATLRQIGLDDQAMRDAWANGRYATLPRWTADDSAAAAQVIAQAPAVARPYRLDLMVREAKRVLGDSAGPNFAPPLSPEEEVLVRTTLMGLLAWHLRAVVPPEVRNARRTAAAPDVPRLEPTGAPLRETLTQLCHWAAQARGAARLRRERWLDYAGDWVHRWDAGRVLCGVLSNRMGEADLDPPRVWFIQDPKRPVLLPHCFAYRNEQVNAPERVSQQFYLKGVHGLVIPHPASGQIPRAMQLFCFTHLRLTTPARPDIGAFLTHAQRSLPRLHTVYWDEGPPRGPASALPPGWSWYSVGGVPLAVHGHRQVVDRAVTGLQLPEAEARRRLDSLAQIPEGDLLMAFLRAVCHMEESSDLPHDPRLHALLLPVLDSALTQPAMAQRYRRLIGEHHQPCADALLGMLVQMDLVRLVGQSGTLAEVAEAALLAGCLDRASQTKKLTLRSYTLRDDQSDEIEDGALLRHEVAQALQQRLQSTRIQPGPAPYLVNYGYLGQNWQQARPQVIAEAHAVIDAEVASGFEGAALALNQPGPVAESLEQALTDAAPYQAEVARWAARTAAALDASLEPQDAEAQQRADDALNQAHEDREAALRAARWAVLLPELQVLGDRLRDSRQAGSADGQAVVGTAADA